MNIVLQKEINTYLNIAMPLCALMTCDRYENWFFEHFIQLYSLHNDKNEIRFYFLEDEYFYKELAQQKIVTAKELDDIEIIDYIKDKIDKEEYLILFIDEFYLPGKYAYKNINFVHQILVYGYDEINNSILTIGFDNEQKFCKKEYCNEVFRTAYEKGKQFYSEQAPWTLYKTIELIKLKENVHYEFHLNKALEELRRYLSCNGEKSKIPAWDLELFGDNVIYGVNNYDALSAYLKLHKDQIYSIDYRYLHLFYEHKKALLSRITYISKNYNNYHDFQAILNGYAKVVEKADVIRMLYYKNILYENNFESFNGYLKDVGTIDEISKLINDMKIDEQNCLRQIIK